ncbi:hypothetical protein B0T24DRAFT_574009 [Lasiosphaeria ovina]|uniref:Uncharacterized protein n=1 Tax=Lasiosphaeria ovina TaxID=92902 RepID=A0AAE0NAM4_9PEZI|nr:hypothetical protein B0T24DRAFT_574009 [Lasiosphaeria ovina]
MASITSRPPPAVSPSAASTSVSASSAVLSTSTILTSVNSTKDSDSQTDDSQTIRFTKVRDLFNRIDHTSGDSLTVISMVLPFYFYMRENQGRRYRFCDYDSNSQILIITITTDLHKQLHKRLYNKFLGQVHNMGLLDNWKDIGSTTLLGQQGQSGKEGDSAGGPMPQRTTKGSWPTLVIEAGFSQTLGQLYLIMKRWFSMSNHEVKIVLLIKFDGTRILLEKWEEEVAVRPGATTTRHSLQHPTPVLRQSITITQNATTDPISYNVTRGALVLSFRLLFLRDPGPGEGDLVFSVQELETYAEVVWAQM